MVVTSLERGSGRGGEKEHLGAELAHGRGSPQRAEKSSAGMVTDDRGGRRNTITLVSPGR